MPLSCRSPVQPRSLPGARRLHVEPKPAAPAARCGADSKRAYADWLEQLLLVTVGQENVRDGRVEEAAMFYALAADAGSPWGTIQFANREMKSRPPWFPGEALPSGRLGGAVGRRVGGGCVVIKIASPSRCRALFTFRAEA